MQLKFRSIEFFGVSGAGKTFVREKVKERLTLNGYIVLDSREIIIKNIRFFVKTNLIENLQILYFNFLLIFNIKTTLWNKYLDSIVNKYLKKRKKKYNLFDQNIKKIINEKNRQNFEYHKIWIKELIIGMLLNYDLIKLNKNIIFFPDEGLIQKIFLLSLSKKKIDTVLIKKFLRKKLFCDRIINITSPMNSIIKVMKKRRIKKNGWVLKKNEIVQMYKLEKKIKQLSKRNYIICKANSELEKRIKKITS